MDTLFFPTGSAGLPTAVFLFNTDFVYLHPHPLSLHLPDGISSKFAPHSACDTDYFIMDVYLAAGIPPVWLLPDPRWYGETVGLRDERLNKG